MAEEEKYVSLCSIVTSLLDFDNVVSKIESQSCYYVLFWTNTLGKGMNSPIPTPSYRLSSITCVLLQGWLWH